MTYVMREVPPPSRVPVDPRAKELGLIDGLRVDTHDKSEWRCAACRNYHTDQPQVWIPDIVLYHIGNQTPQSISEACRREAYNGHGTAICLQCARHLGMPPHNIYDRGLIKQPPQTSIGYIMAGAFILGCAIVAMILFHSR